MALVIWRMLREAKRARQPQPPSDLQIEEEERRDEEAKARVHPMEPGWYQDYRDENVRHYFDGQSFTIRERWDGSGWQRDDSPS